VLTILVSVDALKNDQPDIEVAEFAIDRPGAINANVYSMTPVMRFSKRRGPTQ